MAHQLHYTSAVTGLAGRPGFQFVAASPGATAEVQQAVLPHLSYRPPPAAPPQPTPAQLAGLPVGYTFTRDRDAAILVTCRYLGTDYSGRYGNFLGHAVVLGGAELAAHAGLRPVELWGSPIWATGPAVAPAGPAVAPAGAVAGLPDLAELPPGAGTDPEAVAGWLAGAPARCRLLAALVEGAQAALDGTGGPVVLVTDQDQTAARWLAAISYSLPAEAAWRLTFTTYTADPGTAGTHLVGTTTDVWDAGRTGEDRGPGPVFRLDRPAPPPHPPPHPPPGRYATTVAGAWHAGDLAGIDLLHDLAGQVGPGDRDAAAALVAVARGATVPAAEQATAAGLLHRYAGRLPDQVWAGLGRRDLDLALAGAVAEAAAGAGRAGLAEQVAAPAVASALRGVADLAGLAGVLGQAVRLGVRADPAAVQAGAARAITAARQAPGPGSVAAAYAAAAALGAAPAAAVCDGVVDALAAADPERIAVWLPDDACELLVDRSWEAAPRVGAHVLTSYGRRHPAQRAGVTDTLLDLAERRLLPDQEAATRVRELWSDPPPRVPDGLVLLGEGGLLSPARARHPSVRALAQQALATADLTTADAYTLAYRVAQPPGAQPPAGQPPGVQPPGVAPPDDPAAADARAVLAAHQTGPGDPASFAALDRLLPGASRPVRTAASQLASARFAAARPAQQARILLALAPAGPLGTALLRLLTHRPPRRGDPDRAGVAEVAIRLWYAGRAEPTLTGWTVRWAGHPAEGRELRRALAASHSELPRQLARLCQEHRRPAGDGRLSRLFGRG